VRLKPSQYVDQIIVQVDDVESNVKSGSEPDITSLLPHIHSLTGVKSALTLGRQAIRRQGLQKIGGAFAGGGQWWKRNANEVEGGRTRNPEGGIYWWREQEILREGFRAERRGGKSRVEQEWISNKGRKNQDSTSSGGK